RAAAIDGRNGRRPGACGDDRGGVELQVARSKAALDGQRERTAGRRREGCGVRPRRLGLGGNLLLVRAVPDDQGGLEIAEQIVTVLSNFEFDRVGTSGDEILR